MTARIVTEQEIVLRAALRELERAARKLHPEQGRLARRNARARLAAAIRKLRRTVDDSFPRISSQREVENVAGRAARRKLTPHERIKKLREAGWVNVAPGSSAVADCAAAGVRVRRGPNGSLWVRGWVVAVPAGAVGALRKAKGNAAAQRAILSAKMLAESPSPMRLEGTRSGRLSSNYDAPQNLPRDL